MKAKYAKEALSVLLRGVFMGMADVIPGVSGGTIALITGIYERLIFSIRNLNIRFLVHLLRGELRKSKESFLEMDFAFLVPLVIGIGAALLAFSRVIKFLLDYFPANTYAFFFGLILASAGIVYGHVKGIGYGTVVSALVGFVFAFLFTGLGALQASHSLPVVFLSGMIAVCAMILPGISGAFILFFLGQYEYMLGALLLPDIPVIAVFVAGALVGLFVMVRVLSYLLKRRKSVTMAFLVGLMLGALRLPYENIASAEFFLPFVLIAGAAGFFSVVLLEKTAGRFRVREVKT